MPNQGICYAPGAWSFHHYTPLNKEQKLASVILEEERSDSLILTYKNILSSDPHDAEAHLGLAAIYRRQGHNNRAALSYELAAQALAAKGKVHDALAAVQLIIEMSPENVTRRIRLAEQYEQANMHPEAVRELSAAASYLRDKNLPGEYARVIERLRALQAKSGNVWHQAGEAGRRVAASRQTLGKLDPEGDRSQRPSGDSAPQHIAACTEAPCLIAEADSFLRLGLVDKAIEHLEAALARNPFLRALREPLVTLYVAQHRYKQAVGELWELLTQCTDRRQEIRFLRYILWLDSSDQAARQQLSLLLGTHRKSGGKSANEATALSMAAVDSELRHALDSQRPLTDLAITSVIQLGDDSLPLVSAASRPPQLTVPIELSPAESSDPVAPDSGASQLPSATTRPGLAQIEAIAEEIALSSRSFRKELTEIDRCVQAANYDDAIRRLNILASCYPHSRVVQAQVAELEHAQQKQAARGDNPAEQEASDLPVSTELAAAMRALFASPSQCTPTLTELLPRNRKDAVRTTIEIAPGDIEEVSGS